MHLEPLRSEFRFPSECPDQSCQTAIFPGHLPPASAPLECHANPMSVKITGKPNTKHYGIARRALPYLLICILLFGMAVGLSFAATAKEVPPSKEDPQRMLQPLMGSELA